ncbi:amidohydrolase [Prauserella cavernicola]|uniref:Amidohydrolase n=1 Tax=Prauserella cavernicola TaxID=2800127 RepID=A0A934V9B2_9PSEU|nr:amidohydrolase [Prauserella cavernicola]MBK1789160.1 amidohydrolase [Prauserella cavernicola]
MVSHLFVNAKVFTGRDETDFASAFRITDGSFSWVGDHSEVRGEQAVDLGGRTVLPGLLDVHTHPAALAALTDAVDCLPPQVVSLAQLLDRLRTHRNLGGGADQWIIGRGYDEARYPEGRSPTAHDLDQVSLTQPVIVKRCDGHTAVCNTRALELAGITSATPDPVGARFERDEQGRPNGILTELEAVRAVERLLPALGGDDLADRLAGLDERFLSRGIVGVCDLRASTLPDPLATFRAARARGLRPRCTLYLEWDPGRPPDDLSDEDRLGPVRIGGLKLFMDGAYSNRTAWVNDPYPDSCEHGIHTVSDEDARAAVDWARRNQVQVAVHAMGDQALEHVVELFGEAEPWLAGRPSIRLEHATLVSAGLIERITSARMSFGIATHTIFLYAEHDSYRANLSAEQARVAYPIRSLYHGVRPLALASDCPATAWSDADNVFVSVKAAVARRAYNGADIGQAEAITVPQALSLYTGRARHVAPLGQVGVIAPGYDGSFVVLDRDVFTVAHEDIDQVRIDQTWIEGAQVYAR